MYATIGPLVDNATSMMDHRCILLIRWIQMWAAVDMIASQTQCIALTNATVGSNFSYSESGATSCNGVAAGDLWGLSCFWTTVVVFALLMLLLIELWFFEVDRTLMLSLVPMVGKYLSPCYQRDSW